MPSTFENQRARQTWEEIWEEQRERLEMLEQQHVLLNEDMDLESELDEELDVESAEENEDEDEDEEDEPGDVQRRQGSSAATSPTAGRPQSQGTGPRPSGGTPPQYRAPPPVYSAFPQPPWPMHAQSMQMYGPSSPYVWWQTPQPVMWSPPPQPPAMQMYGPPMYQAPPQTGQARMTTPGGAQRYPGDTCRCERCETDARESRPSDVPTDPPTAPRGEGLRAPIEVRWPWDGRTECYEMVVTIRRRTEQAEAREPETEPELER